MRPRTNIAFAGLTAAGKTTHAKLLAAELGYRYVSATRILLDIVGYKGSAERVWFENFEAIEDARQGWAADIELEKRLLEINRTQERVVFDTWAFAWIGPDPLLRIWIESDLPSRTRKCMVSQGEQALSLSECEALVSEKDESTRQNFIERHGFDLFEDREKYDLILDNSLLIPEPTVEASTAGISQFAPQVSAAVGSFFAIDATAGEGRG